MFDLKDGRPERTRTADLYRVKVNLHSSLRAALLILRRLCRFVVCPGCAQSARRYRFCAHCVPVILALLLAGCGAPQLTDYEAKQQLYRVVNAAAVVKPSRQLGVCLAQIFEQSQAKYKAEQYDGSDMVAWQMGFRAGLKAGELVEQVCGSTE